MTSLTKLILSFTVVILFMVGGITAYILYWQGQEGHEAAAHKIGTALNKLNSDFAKIQIVNREFASRLAHDTALAKSLSEDNKNEASNILKKAASARNFAGCLALFDSSGKLFYSSDSPAKFGYSMRGKSPGLDYVLNSLDNFTGLTVGLTVAQPVAVTAMSPIIGDNGKCQGVVAVSDPINEEFLTGESMKFALLSEPIADIDFIMLRVRGSNFFYLTPGLLKDKIPYVQLLSEHGVKELPGWQDDAGWFGGIGKWFANLFHADSGINAGFVRDGRFWQSYNLGNVGVIVAATVIHAQGIKPGFIIVIVCILGLLAFVLAVVLSAKISNFEAPVQELITYVKRWQEDKPPGQPEGFTGVWNDLAQNFHEILQSKHHYVEALKMQLNKTTQQVNEIAKAEQNSGGQFAALDRQVSNQNRQISEFSRQLNYANQQNVFLQQELQAILQSTTEGFLVLDPYGNVLSANNIFLNWQDVSEAEIAGRFCFDLIKKPGEQQSKAAIDNDPGRAFVKHESNPAALIDQFFPEGIIYHSKTGATVEVLLHLQPIAGQDGSIQGYILVVRDKSLRSEIVKLRAEMINMLARAIRSPLITAEKEWQSLLINNGQQSDHPDFQPSPALELKQKIDLTQSEQSPGTDAEKSADSEKMPVAVDVQRKLSDLHSHYQNLIRSVESLLTAHGQSIEQLELSAQNEAQLIEGLDTIFLRPEALKVEPFSLTRVVGDCLEEVSGIARGRHLVLDHKTSTALPSVNGNKAIIKSILAPIIDKIISITDSGGKVRVESTFKEKEITLAISSSGPALSEEEIVDMFAGFIPGKHSEETYGARLSLYLARNNAERIGAHLWSQSEQTEGTTIFITLPIG